MSRWENNIVACVLLAAFISMMVLFFAMLLDQKNQDRCVDRWSESSTPSKVSKAGCMVERSPGNWVPEEFMLRSVL